MDVTDDRIVYVGPGEGTTVLMPDKELMRCKVRSDQTGGAYSLFEVEVRPGAALQAHIQHHEDECFYVLEGRFEFLNEDDRIEAGPGSLVYVPKGNLHAFRNSANTIGRLLALQTPGGVHERYVEEVGEPVMNNGVSPAKEKRSVEGLAATGAQYGIEMVPLSP